MRKDLTNDPARYAERGDDMRAVLWDFGGVITTSPFDAFAEYELRSGLEPGFIRALNATNPDSNAWALLERGEITLDEFAPLFEAEAARAGGKLNAPDVLSALNGQIRPEMVEALRRCHERLRTGLLTNNFASMEATSKDSVAEHFDVVIESSKVGLRKPEAAFYQLACDRLDVSPCEAVFLDDLGINLKPARAMGMATIKVSDPATAIAELEALVGFELR